MPSAEVTQHRVTTSRLTSPSTCSTCLVHVVTSGSAASYQSAPFFCLFSFLLVVLWFFFCRLSHIVLSVSCRVGHFVSLWVCAVQFCSILPSASRLFLCPLVLVFWFHSVHEAWKLGRPRPPGVISWVLANGAVTYRGSCDLKVSGHMTQAVRCHVTWIGRSHDLSLGGVVNTWGWGHCPYHLIRVRAM